MASEPAAAEAEAFAKILESSPETSIVAPPRPAYWVTDGGNPETRWVTRFMRRKVEYLLRSCDEHVGPHNSTCAGQTSLSQARVVRVERIENKVLWDRYARKLATLSRQESGLGRGQRYVQKLRGARGLPPASRYERSPDLRQLVAQRSRRRSAAGRSAAT